MDKKVCITTVETVRITTGPKTEVLSDGVKLTCDIRAVENIASAREFSFEQILFPEKTDSPIQKE